MSTVTKKDLISQFAKELSLPVKTSSLYVNTVLDLITKNLVEDNIVDITGFGKFVVKSRGERPGMSPVTKEQIVIPASKTVKFTLKKGLKDAVNGEDSSTGAQQENTESK
ncbi:HU family DNA-binding protein [Erysipelotrichaceae bacterium RD49]|nr:HU family DNA-binding protein [Erysipelotrichaceae bacterium RD49]